jgi:hypothetical protein
MSKSDSERFAEILQAAFLAGGETLPHVPWRASNEEGKVVLTFSQEGEDGEIEIRFTPGQRVLTHAEAVGRGLTKHILDSLMHGEVTGESTMRQRVGEDATRMEAEWPDTIATWFMVFFAHCFHNNLALAMRAAPREAELITNAKAAEIQTRAVIDTFDNLTDIRVSGLEESLHMLVELAAKEKQQLLEQYLRATSPAPQLERIGEHYKRLHPIWRDIKKFYSERGQSPAWRDMVKLEYGDEQFDDDLLTRITGNLESLSEPTLNLMEEKGGDCTPSTIAIEHAARLCGAWRYQFHVRKLFREAGVRAGSDDGG